MTNTNSSDLHESFLQLIRLGIGTSNPSKSLGADVKISKDVNWTELKALADEQGLSTIVLDGIDKLNDTITMPVQKKLEWIGEVVQNYEQRYAQYEKAICSLAGWHNQHGFRMMVLKGYACSLNWPKPEHRPCGDIDIWQFGMQKEADKVLASSFKFQDSGFKIDTGHHHHTVFEWQGFTVENHYDFLNIHHHKSNVKLEAILKDLGKDDSHYVDVDGERVYLPSANLHALFLLRHSMSNFAAAGMTLRQLLDWAFLVEKHGEEIDWDWLEDTLERFGMKRLYDVFNAICVGDLGFDVNMFPKVQFNPELKDRVLNDILFPEFSEKEIGGFLSRLVYKFRRWRANAWKHELCFKESMWSAFWSGVWSHLLKPSSI